MRVSRTNALLCLEFFCLSWVDVLTVVCLRGPDFNPGKENAERDSLSEVLLRRRLRRDLEKINPGLSDEAYEIAIGKLEGLSSPDLVENNRKFHDLLLSGCKVSITDEKGKPDTKLVKYVDFENPENNDFLAVRQFMIKQHESKRTDHIVFVNGIPLVILEYKDPTSTSATIKDAFHQLGDTDYQRYIPKLFHYNAFLVISDRTLAKYGTLTSNFEYFFEWKDSQNKNKKISNQLDVLQRGLFEKDRLLHLIQNFIEYEDDGTKIIKKIARQHQVEAVNTIAEKAKQVLSQKDENRIGVVWHTTGSGKSLTMIFAVQYLSQLPEFENPTFVIITDRRDLDEQIAGFFTTAGFPYPRAPTSVLEAEGIDDLREKLETPAGKIIFTTIQKFQTTKEEKEGRIKYPKISDRRNIIIIADEAHRSQYRKIAQNLQIALPNALRLGFTGTPIEMEDRSITDVFGSVISTYKIPEAVRDKTTVEIAYEGRRIDLHLLNQFIGKDFAEITEDIDEEATEVLSKKWTEMKKLFEDPDRIQVIAKDLVDHFNEKKKVLNGKAMLCASSKKAAAMYKEFIDKQDNHPECVCVISGSKKKSLEGLSDEKKTLEDYLNPHYRSKQEIKELIKNFKDEKNPVELLIVCDMLLTGFDAPLLHTMYVDKPLRDHNLIQAISRVNRIWKDKPQGLIVDYIGIGDDLRKSFKAFAEQDIKEAMKPTKEIILYMQNKHDKLINFFETPISDYPTLPEDKQVELIYNAIDEIVEDDDVKRKFVKNVTELTKAYAVCTPNPACQEVEDDLRTFQKLRKILSKSTSNSPQISDEKESAIQDLVEKGIGTNKIIKQFSIEYDPEKINLNKELDKLRKYRQKNLKVELAYKLLDDAITAKFKRNAIARKTFLERIENALSKYHGRFENFETTMTRIIEIGNDVTNQKKKEEELGLSEEEYIFYEAVAQAKEYAKSDDTLKAVSIQLTDFLKQNTTIDWMNQESIKAKIRAGIKRILLESDYVTESFEKLIPVIMVQAENNYAEI